MAKIEITIPDGKLRQVYDALATRVGISDATNNEQRSEFIKTFLIQFLQTSVSDHLNIAKHNEAALEVRKTVELEVKDLKIS